MLVAAHQHLGLDKNVFIELYDVLRRHDQVRRQIYEMKKLLYS